MARKRKPTSREERVLKASRQMKLLSLFFLITAVGSFFSERYVGSRRYMFVTLFIILAAILWRQSKPEILRRFRTFDRDRGDKMF